MKSSLHTAIRAFREAAAAGDKDKAAELLASTSRKLDKAASKGVIHKNQAANKKSALARGLQQALINPGRLPAASSATLRTASLPARSRRRPLRP